MSTTGVGATKVIRARENTTIINLEVVDNNEIEQSTSLAKARMLTYTSTWEAWMDQHSLGGRTVGFDDFMRCQCCIDFLGSTITMMVLC